MKTISIELLGHLPITVEPPEDGNVTEEWIQRQLAELFEYRYKIKLLASFLIANEETKLLVGSWIEKEE